MSGYRKSHNGKDRFDKEEYRKILSLDNSLLDRTETENEEMDKTSNISGDSKVNKKPKIQKKSLKYKIKDNGLLITIVGGLILLFIAGCINFLVRQSENTSNIKINTDSLDKMDNQINGESGLIIKYHDLDNQINGKRGIEEQLKTIQINQDNRKSKGINE